MNEVLFKERQKFTQLWLWVILLGINAIFLIGAYLQIFEGQQFGNKSMSNQVLLLTTGLILLLTVLFMNSRLDTQIKYDGIYVRFFPFHLSFKHYPWKNITKAYVRKYNPIGEYGGWGIRLGLPGSGRAYNISGNNGLQLEFNDHKKLLIGTNKPDEMTAALGKISPLSSP